MAQRLGLIFMLICGLIFSSCGGDASDNGGGELTIVAGGSPSGMSGIMRLALVEAAEDFDGINVELQNMSQRTAILAAREGEIDVVFMSWVNLTQAQNDGFDFVGVAPSWASHASILVPADSSAQSIEDIVGMRLGSSNRVTGVFTETYAVLEAMGIDMEEDFALTPTDDGAILEGLFREGQFDAVQMSESAVTRVLHDGFARELMQVGHFLQEQTGSFVPVNSWAASREWIEENDVDRMRQLFERANEIAKENADIYLENGEMVNLDEDGLQLLYERFSPLVVPSYTEDNLALVQEAIDRNIEIGLIEGDWMAEDLIAYAP